MRRVWAVMLCGGAGFWLGVYYQVPQWVLWPLVVLGALTWLLGEWLERREAKNDKTH